MRTNLLLLAGLILLAGACGDGPSQGRSPEKETGAKPPGRKTMTITVTSSAFENSQPIPKKHTGDGQDISPPLAWRDFPEEAKEFALICDDPDAPRAEPWVHWVLYKIPASVHSLDEGHSGGAVEGANDFGNRGYGGPAPPRGHGVHHYHFKLYALDEPLALEPGATKKQLLDAMEEHILGQGDLVGTYERK
jgi:hypothetical protein